MNNICKDISIYFRCHCRTFPDQSQAIYTYMRVNKYCRRRYVTSDQRLINTLLTRLVVKGWIDGKLIETELEVGREDWKMSRVQLCYGKYYLLAHDMFEKNSLIHIPKA